LLFIIILEFYGRHFITLILLLDGPGFVPDVFDVVYFEVFQKREKETEKPDQERGVDYFDKK